MRFVVIKRSDDTYLAMEYDKPYSYSEYTSGGDYVSKIWVEAYLLFGNESESDIESCNFPVIFESKEKAEAYLEDYVSGHQYEIIVLESLI